VEEDLEGAAFHVMAPRGIVLDRAKYWDETMVAIDKPAQPRTAKSVFLAAAPVATRLPNLSQVAVEALRQLTRVVVALLVVPLAMSVAATQCFQCCPHFCLLQAFQLALARARLGLISRGLKLAVGVARDSS
jgi:hypothetical protein